MAEIDAIRSFVSDALAKAKATTDDQIRATAEASNHAGGPNYGFGLRDGVVIACEQVLAKIDE